MTEPPITKHYYYGPAQPWIEWVQINTKGLLKNYKDEIKENGLWIVLQVYLTKTANITILDSLKRDTQIGFKADVASVGNVNPHGGWHAESNDSGWFKYPSKVRSRDLNRYTLATDDHRMMRNGLYS